MDSSNLNPGEFSMVPDYRTGQLFQVGAASPREPNHATSSAGDSPLGFAERPDVSWHASDSDELVIDSDHRQFHAGTPYSAAQRRPTGWLHPVRANAPFSLAHGLSRSSEHHFQRMHDRSPQVFSDEDANLEKMPWGTIDRFTRTPEARSAGSGTHDTPGAKVVRGAYGLGHIVPYINEIEDPGSISYSTTNPDAFKTWVSLDHPDMNLVGRISGPVFNEDVEFEQHPFPRMGDDAVIKYTPRSFKYPEESHNVKRGIPSEREKQFDVPLGYHSSSVNEPAPASETVRQRDKREDNFYEKLRLSPQFNLYLGLRKSEY